MKISELEEVLESAKERLGDVAVLVWNLNEGIETLPITGLNCEGDHVELTIGDNSLRSVSELLEEKIKSISNRFLEEELVREYDRDVAVLSKYQIITKDDTLRLLRLLYSATSAPPIGENFKTSYPIGDSFTIGYISKTIIDIRKDKNGFNEYLLDDGRWVTGKYITFCCD